MTNFILTDLLTCLEKYITNYERTQRSELADVDATGVRQRANEFLPGRVRVDSDEQCGTWRCVGINKAASDRVAA